MINAIQSLRVIAAWMVVFHHFTQIYFNFQTTTWFDSFFATYGAYGVDLFFIISGFVIYHATADKIITPTQFLLQRLARIVPAYWFFTSVVAILLLSFEGLIPLSAFEPTFFIKSLLFLPTHNPSGIGLYPLLTIGWTLNYEMVFYLIFSLTLYFPLKFRFLLTTLVLLALIALSSKTGSGFSFYANKMLLEFILGLIISILWRNNLIQQWHPLWAIILFLSAIMLFCLRHPGHHLLYTGIPCAFIFIAAISQNRWFTNRWLIHAGNWSYSTYLCHLIVLAAARPLYTIWHINPFLILGLCCLLILMISFVSYTFIEKPMQRLGRYRQDTLSFTTTFSR